MTTLAIGQIVRIDDIEYEVHREPGATTPFLHPTGMSKLEATPEPALPDPAEDAVLREAAQRLCDTYADLVTVRSLGLGWKVEMDADDAFMCALQDTRTALDGRERPHVHKERTNG